MSTATETPTRQSTLHRRNRQVLLAVYTSCYRCGRPATEADHLVPFSVCVADGWSDDETHDLSNLIPSCSLHNKERRNSFLTPEWYAYVDRYFPPISDDDALRVYHAITNATPVAHPA